MTVVLFSRPRCCKFMAHRKRGDQFSDWVRDAGELNDLACAHGTGSGQGHEYTVMRGRLDHHGLLSLSTPDTQAKGSGPVKRKNG